MRAWKAMTAAAIVTIGATTATPAIAATDNGNIVNERTDAVQFGLNACNGELVSLSGTVHFVETRNSESVRANLVEWHLTGVGDQGNRYVLNIQSHGNTSNVDPVDVFHFRSQDVLVSQGPAPNSKVVVTESSPPLQYNVEANCSG